MLKSSNNNYIATINLNRPVKGNMEETNTKPPNIREIDYKYIFIYVTINSICTVVGSIGNILVRKNVSQFHLNTLMNVSLYA